MKNIPVNTNKIYIQAISKIKRAIAVIVVTRINYIPIINECN